LGRIACDFIHDIHALRWFMTVDHFTGNDISAEEERMVQLSATRSALLANSRRFQCPATPLTAASLISGTLMHSCGGLFIGQHQVPIRNGPGFVTTRLQWKPVSPNREINEATI
jgi:hypothetical protein